jgi:Glycosyl transferases group 1
MNLRVLHGAFTRHRELGIERQMKWEQEAANSLNLTWKTVYQYGTQPRYIKRSTRPVPYGVETINWIRNQRVFLKEMLSYSGSYDAILLRYTPHLPMIIWFIVQSRKPVFLVHHTLEVKELLCQKPPLNVLRAMAETIIRIPIHLLSRGTVSATPEISETFSRSWLYKRKLHFVYPNGIMQNITDTPDKKSTTPTLLFIAGRFLQWHGLELLIDQAAESNENFKIHVVGKVSNDILSRAVNDARFEFHGILNMEDISVLANECHLGISTLALHKKGMSQACPLKVREYLSLGLPVVGDHLEVFPGTFPYYKQVKPHIREILDRFEEFKYVKRNKVIEKSLPLIDKRYILGNLYMHISTNLKSEI